MGNFADYYYSRVKGTATIGGKAVPLQWFRVTYGIDTIPVATFGVSIGRDASSLSRSSAVGLLSSISPFTPVELSLQIAPGVGGAAPPGKSQGFPSGSFKIFEGFIRTPGSDKVMEGANATLTFDCFGASAGLGGSTQMATGYASQDIEGFGTAITVGTKVNGTISLSHVQQLIKSLDSVLRDVGQTIFSVFSELIKTTSAWNNVTNSAANDAINRLNLDGQGTGALKAPPLRLNQTFAGPASDRLLISLASFYVSRVWDRWRASPLYPGADLWEVLMAIREGMLFHYVPAVNEDALVPLTLNLGGSVGDNRFIEPNEFWQIRFTPQDIDRKFYAYTTKAAMFGTALTNSLFQGRMPAAQRIGYAEIGGLVGNGVAGKMLLIDALNEAPFVLCPGAPASDGGLGGKQAYDASGSTGTAPTTDQGTVTDTYYSAALGNGVAGARLHDELFKHRICQITGRFRMDLSPGTLVKIRTPADRFSPNGGDMYYGHIGQVDLVGGDQGGGGQLGTQLTLLNIRTQLEQDSYTTPEHPLYKLKWEGGSLI